MVAVHFPSAHAATNVCDGNKNAVLMAKVQASKVTNVDRVSDGVVPEQGDDWNTNLTTRIDPSGYVEWDFGQEITMSHIYLVADNNDSYIFSSPNRSNDNQEFQQFLRVEPHPAPGMQARLAVVSQRTRYLRIQPGTGDGKYSIGEIAIFCQEPTVWPPSFITKQGETTSTKKSRANRLAMCKIVLAVLCLLVFLGLEYRKEQTNIRKVMGVYCLSHCIVLGVVVGSFFESKSLTTLPQMAIILVWAIPLGLLLWGIWAWMAPSSRQRIGRQTKIIYGIVILCGLMAWTNFLSFHETRATHLWDTFHYYVGSKYFHELGYEKLYECAMVAEIEDGRALEMESRLRRELRTNSLMKATKGLQPNRCRQAFSTERWAAFRQDLRVFRYTMGDSWWQDMFKDHGFNASPVWTMLARPLSNYRWQSLVPDPSLVFSPATAELSTKATINRIFTQQQVPKTLAHIHALLFVDFLLIAAALAILWWAFGGRCSALAATVLGCGYPWAYFWNGGSFGRMPWLFCLIAAVCFAKKKRFIFTGSFAALSTLLRVFPAAICLGLGIKAITYFARYKNLHRHHIRIVIGATVTGLCLLVASSFVLEKGSHQAFFQNSKKHMDTPLTNHMGIPTLLSYAPSMVARNTVDDTAVDPFGDWKQARKDTRKQRTVLFWSFLLLGLLWLAWLCPRIADWECFCVSIVAPMLFFELTCYYYSFVLLLVPLAATRVRTTTCLIAATVCGQWTRLGIGWYDEQYLVETLIIVAATLYVLGDRSWRAKNSLAPLLHKKLGNGPDQS